MLQTLGYESLRSYVGPGPRLYATYTHISSIDSRLSHFDSRTWSTTTSPCIMQRCRNEDMWLSFDHHRLHTPHMYMDLFPTTGPMVLLLLLLLR